MLSQLLAIFSLENYLSQMWFNVRIKILNGFFFCVLDQSPLEFTYIFGTIVSHGKDFPSPVT